MLAAVSGGPDSTALLHLLCHLRQTYDITIGIAHLNHLLRPEEADRDSDFVRSLARKLALPSHIESTDINALSKKERLSIETAGRLARYDFFDRIADRYGYTKIATGHTRNDNAEQVLMNLIRGTGAKGLCGIPACRNHRIIRPMIGIAKTQILNYLNRNQLRYMEDSSNSDPAFLRNRIRNQLIPALEQEYNSEVVESLTRVSRIMQMDNDYLDRESKKAFTDCRISRTADSLDLSVPRLEALHPALQNRVLRRSIQTLKSNLNRISFAHLQEVIQFSFTAPSGKSLDLPDQIRVYKKREHIKIKKENRPLRDIGKANKRKRKR